ncbi:signal peptidase I [Pseudodesulfovibrio karagichevae]|uniref:Signal peptidase I n=1 Tax=Pseudodesulfovibrio karagichevae TaxID=3239305 RepID=A0ABV4K1L2_9BACT
MADIDAPAAAVAKPRNPWLALVLSLAAVGLGQVYNGQWKKGAGFYLAELLVALVMVLFWADFAAMLLCVSILLGYNLFVAGEAFATARKSSGYTFKPCNRWWIYLLCLAVSLGSGAAFERVVKGWFFKAYEVPSASMLPTIRVGDHFMVEVLEPEDALKRGDIVIFCMPETRGRDFVKRIVGLPGETVEIKARQVFVDGAALSEPYVCYTRQGNLPVRDIFGPVTLGAGEYFLMGDNREDSFDSRWLGPVPRDKITGRAGYIYFPGDMNAPDWADRLGAPLR